MSPLLLECPKCHTGLMDGVFGLDLAPCPDCRALLQVEVFPAFFRRAAPGREGDPILVEGESSCFYHSEKKAVVPCEICGRFLCALCDCEIKGQHLCPACLEAGQRKKSIQGLEDMRVLYSRMALMLALVPLFITGLAALYVVLHYRKEPGSLVSPMRWALPVAFILGSLQTLGFLALFAYLWLH